MRSFLKIHAYPYLGADAIAAELAPHDVASVQVQAGREFLLRVDETLARAESFIVESTLSGKTLQRTMQRAKERGYSIIVILICIDRAEDSIDRVGQRVRKGGHHVAEGDIRRRFLRCYENFWRLYKPLADSWLIEYNGGVEFSSVAMGEGTNVVVYDQAIFEWFLNVVGNQ